MYIIQQNNGPEVARVCMEVRLGLLEHRNGCAVAYLVYSTMYEASRYNTSMDHYKVWRPKCGGDGQGAEDVEGLQTY